MTVNSDRRSLHANDLARVQTDLREAMGNVAAAVAVVTTVDEGGPHGTTVSAFMSLSLDPPMVAVSLDRASTLLSKLEVGSPVAVNVLAAHHDQVALRFATKSEDTFDGIAWRIEHGAPALLDRHAGIAGQVASLIAGGDHVLVLVDVIAAEASSAPVPLTYWRRTFGTHQVF